MKGRDRGRFETWGDRAGTIKVLDAATVGPFWMHLYNYSWFVGFGVAFAVYGVLRAIKPLHNHSTAMTR